MNVKRVNYFFLIIVLFYCCNSISTKKQTTDLNPISGCDSLFLSFNKHSPAYANELLNRVNDTFIYYRCKYYNLKIIGFPVIYNLTGGKSDYIMNDKDFDPSLIYAYDDFEVGSEQIGGIFYRKNNDLVLFSNLDGRDSNYFWQMIERIKTDFPSMQESDSLIQRIVNRRKYVTRALL